MEMVWATRALSMIFVVMGIDRGMPMLIPMIGHITEVVGDMGNLGLGRIDRCKDLPIPAELGKIIMVEITGVIITGAK